MVSSNYPNTGKNNKILLEIFNKGGVYWLFFGLLSRKEVEFFYFFERKIFSKD